MEMKVALDFHGATRTGRYKRMLKSLDDHLAVHSYDIVHAMLPVRHADIYHPHAGMAAGMLKDWNILFNPRRRLMAEVEQESVNRSDTMYWPSSSNHALKIGSTRRSG